MAPTADVSSEADLLMASDAVTSQQQTDWMADPSLLGSWQSWIKLVVICLVSVLIITSNILNIMGWMRVKHIAMATRIFLLNLSVSDLCVGLIACAPSIYPAVTASWPYGDIWCQVSGIMHGSSCAVSIWSISVVSLDRFLAVTWPMKYVTMVTKCRCAIVIGALWTCAIGTFVSACLTKSNFIYFQYQKVYIMCGLYWEYREFCVIASIYIPILCGSILLFSSVKIARALKTSSKFRQSSRGTHKSSVTSMNRKALKVVIATSTIYFILWGPYVTLVVSEALAPSLVNLTPDWLSFCVLWLANSNSGVNVLVYSFTNNAFRAHLLNLLLPCIRKDNIVENSLQSNDEAGDGRSRSIGHAPVSMDTRFQECRLEETCV